VGRVGLARESLSRALSTPQVAAHLRTTVLKSLAMAAARAGAVKVDLLLSDNAIARNRDGIWLFHRVSRDVPVFRHHVGIERGFSLAKALQRDCQPTEELNQRP
jgi:hypothetical protein